MAVETDSIPLNQYHGIADSLFHLKKYDAAIINYEKAVEIYHSKKEWEQEVICLNAIGGAEGKSGEYDKAIETLDKSLDLGLTHLGENNEHLAKTFHLKCINYFRKGDYYKATFSEQEAIKRWKIVFGEKNLQMATGYNMLGLCNKNAGFYNEALDYYLKALNISENVLDSLDWRIASIINNLSTVYRAKGDYDNALKYSKRAINITLNTEPVDLSSLASKYNTIGLIYDEMNDTSEAYEYYKQALDIRLEILDKNHPDLATSYINMGKLNKIMGEYSQALDYYFKSLKIYQKINNGMHPDIAMCYYNICNIYNEKGESGKALGFNLKALDIWSIFYRKNHPHIAACYLTFSDIYKSMGDLEKAMGYTELALNANSLNGQILSDKEQLLILSGQADIYINCFNNVTKDTLDLIKALAVFKDISALADNLRKSYQTKGSMLVLSKAVSENYLEAVRISYLLFEKTNNAAYKEEAFFFAEKNKANVLVEAILESRSQTYSGILDSLIRQENKLKLQLEDCDARRKEMIFNKGKRDKEKINELEAEFTLLGNSYDSLIKVFEKNYQNYFLLKYSTSILSAKDVRQRLPNGSAMIGYMTSDSILYIFSITKKEFSLTKVKTDSVGHFVNKLRKSLSQLSIKNLNKHSIDSYCYYAYRLYNLLIKPVEDKLQATDLIIIPDGKLGYIPFETLLTRIDMEINFSKLPYLMNKYSISYGNSATIQFDLLNSLKCNAKDDFLGIAPFTQKDTSFQSVYNKDTLKLTSLPSSKQEVESIQKMVGGQIFEDSSATLQNFLEEAANFKILHIATHGVVDDMHPLESRLFFYQNPPGYVSELKIEDLFGLSFNSELAVLSACNTGYGKLEKGEGIMSLARGFSYAGVPGVAMSLWNVNDKSTSEIMKSFYSYLKDGYTRNEALRQAKMDYIKNSDQVFASPYYWGGFVYIGKNDAIDFKNGRRNYWLLLFIVPVLGLAFIYLRKKK
jgi:CHAT domain-containing protein/Tfp pilus assembly protein PilF